MGQVSPYLRRVKAADRSVGYGHYCPGCDRIHIIWTMTPPPRPCWGFNGNVEKPTFTPSVLIFLTDPETNARETECHYNITDGRIVFHGDSPHALKGQTVPLPALPDRYADDRYGWPDG